MAENKKSFVAYVDWKTTFDVLPDEKAGQLIKHLFAYVNDENPVTDDILINVSFANIKQTLKRDLIKWENELKSKSNGGKKGMEKRWGNKDNNSLTKDNIVITPDNIVKEVITPITVSVNDSVNVNEEKKKKIFNPPTIEELKTYFKENGYKEETAVKMFNSYSVADWHDSKGNKIKNWKQKAINVWFTDENKIQISQQKHAIRYTHKLINGEYVKVTE